MSFKDHFSGHAALYAQFRPRYPDALFHYLASLAPDHGCAWDCATGNGQAASGLAPHFHRVIATDASAQQIENAIAHRGVEYRVAAAEHSGIEANSIDLVTVAQALHWFDIQAFFSEARRVLKPNGIVAVWAYTLMSISPEIDPIVENYYRNTTAPFWPPERDIVDAGYSTIAFPFEELAAPSLEIEERWTRAQALGYLRSWSATQKLIAARGDHLFTSFGKAMAEAWPDADTQRSVRWPLCMRVGRIVD